MDDFKLSAIQEDIYRTAKAYMDEYKVPVITQRMIMEGICNRFQVDAFNEMAKVYPALVKMQNEKEKNKDTQKDSRD